MRRNELILLIVVVGLCVSTIYIIFIWLPLSERAAIEDHYSTIMKRLNSEENRTRVRSWFEKNYSFTELLEWLHDNLEFASSNETFERNTDPAKILESGKGRCEEFSILYLSACISHGYEGRLVAATDVGNPWNLQVPHMWVEIASAGGWVHVDPSEQEWDDRFMYRSWKWGLYIGSRIRMYAFDKEGIEDITFYYTTFLQRF